MATDALTQLQPQVTKTATFQGAAYDFITRPSPYQHNWCRVLYSAATNASGSNSVTFTIEGSTDGSTWGTIGGARPSDVVSLTTTPQAGELYLPIMGFVGLRYTRLVATFAGAGTGATCTYVGDMVPGAPA